MNATGTLDPSIIYRFGPAEDAGLIASMLWQSGAWLDATNLAERSRYTNLTFERICTALETLHAEGAIERMHTYDWTHIYRTNYRRVAA
jgi:hypothetical protein